MKRFWNAAATSLALCGLFLVVYSSCNWISGLRPNVGSIFFGWERRIPFVPALIVPYMSIDLFFIVAPFVVNSDLERTVLARRIAAAIIIAGISFLVFPLRFAFDRPQVHGLLGLIFNNFRILDKPYNQCPSLHVALCVILAQIYWRALRGIWRLLLAIWFGLIAISPVLTYQHHIIDVLGGAVLALFVFHFISQEPLLQPYQPNRRVGAYYAMGAVIFAAISLLRTPWTLPLILPAISIAIVSIGYIWIGPGVYRKTNGKLRWTTKILLAPVLLGQRISLAYYARHSRPYDAITNYLWIGRFMTQAEALRAASGGITAVIDLTAEFSEPRCFRDLAYLSLPILDLTAPTPGQVKQAVAFIGRNASSGIVYVHCKAGYSRTAAIAGAYLLSAGKAAVADEAVSVLRRARPSIILRPEAIDCLKRLATDGASRRALHRPKAVFESSVPLLPVLKSSEQP